MNTFAHQGTHNANRTRPSRPAARQTAAAEPATFATGQAHSRNRCACGGGCPRCETRTASSEPETTGSLPGEMDELAMFDAQGNEIAEMPAQAEDQSEEAAQTAQAAPEGEAPPQPSPAPATAARAIIVGPREMWYFNNETPPNYRTRKQLRTNRAGGTFNWSVSSQLTLSSPTDARPVVTTRDKSASRDDAWIRIQHTAADGTVSAASYSLTVLAPDSLTHLRNVDNPDGTYAYSCEIHYSIHDQFGTQLPRDVPINEQFTAAPTADFAGMDWRRGNEGSSTVSPADWFDHIQGESAGHTPAPVAPGSPDAGVAVYHWPGTWRVGSLTIGNGRNVANVTWQKYRGYARHT